MSKIDLLQGTLDMLILRVLSGSELHGWGIADRIQILSKNVLNVGEGSLYPALYRLQQQGWIESEWGTSENNRKAKFYRLTKSGRKQLEREKETWDRLISAIGEIMEGACFCHSPNRRVRARGLQVRIPVGPVPDRALGLGELRG